MVHFCKWKLPFYTWNFLPQMILWFYDLQVSILWGKSQYIVTIFLQSDPVAILIIFAVRFSAATNRGQLLFQGSVYFTVYSWIRYMWAIQLGLIDIGSSARSLSAPLTAVNTSLRNPRDSSVSVSWSDYYTRLCATCTSCGYYYRVVFISLEAPDCVTTIRGRCLI